MKKNGFGNIKLKILTRAANTICIAVIFFCFLIIIMPRSSVAFDDLVKHESILQSSWVIIFLLFTALVILVTLFALYRDYKLGKTLMARLNRNILNKPLEQYGAEPSEKEEAPTQTYNSFSQNAAVVSPFTSAVSAQEAQIKRQIDENAAEAAKYTDLARQALEAGKEDDARIFARKKQALEAARDALDFAYENVVNMRQMHDNMTINIQRRMGAFNVMGNKPGTMHGSKTTVTFKSGSEPEVQTWTYNGDNTAGSNKGSVSFEPNTIPKDEAEILAEKYAARNNTAGKEHNPGQTDKASVDDEIAKMKEDLGL